MAQGDIVRGTWCVGHGAKSVMANELMPVHFAATICRTFECPQKDGVNS